MAVSASCPADKIPPFLLPSGSGIPQNIGAIPLRKVLPMRKRRRTALDKHRQFMFLLRQRYLYRLEQDKGQHEFEHGKRQRTRDFAAKLRRSILGGRRVSDKWEPAKQAVSIKQLQETQSKQDSISCKSPGVATEASRMSDEIICTIDKDISALVDEALEARNNKTTSQECSGSHQDTSATAESSIEGKCRPSNEGKPAWALTAEHAAEAEHEEEEELLSFAEKLDYDDYVASLDDQELKRVLQDLQTADKEGSPKGWRKHFVAAMNHMAGKSAVESGRQSDAVKAPSVASKISHGGVSTFSKGTITSTIRAQNTVKHDPAGSRDKDWDTSTSIFGDADEKAGKSKTVQELADALLQENHELRHVHSHASAAGLLKHSMASAGLHGIPQAVSVS